MLERLIRHEMANKGIPALSIALIDDQTVVWARGFGLARHRDSLPATAETVYRVGSVSKLFTAIAVMQLVERGIVALDSPVTRYLPDFRPATSWYQPITVRHILSHRAGLVREPPVGGYGDRSAPSLAATVASLNHTGLVYPPGSWTKYSNAALAVAGTLVERQSGEPFAQYVRRHVLEPLAEDATSFAPTPDLPGRLATGLMWAPHGRFDAPAFELGIAPATGLYSTVLDLGRLLSAVFAGGVGARGRILQPATLEAMWQVQSGDAEARRGYGLGFHVSTLDGRRRIGHDGAVYGFATTVAFLPEERLGVAVSATLDLATGVTTRVADAALRALLAVRAGRPMPEPPVTRAVPPDVAQQLAGRYHGRHRQLELTARDGALFLTPGTLGVPERIGMIGDTLVADDRMDFGERLRPVPDGLVSGRDTLRREPLSKPAPTPERWKGVVGEYASADSSIVVYVFERNRLFVQVGWLFADALSEGLNGALRFPETSIFAGERVVFHRDSSGRATAVEVGGVLLPRRVGPEGGRHLRISPLHPVNDLLRAARAATPPPEPGPFREPDLVDLASVDSTFRFDIRYATTDNFLGSIFYSQPRALLQRPAAEALARAQRRLHASGYSLLIHDGYRPWFVTKVFWDATPPALRWLVANPATGSRHNRGSAVDVALYDLANGRAADMGGSYDEASDRSFIYYPVATARQLWHREVLRQAIEAEGFTAYDAEWWHFDYRDWHEYPLLNVPFEGLTGPAGSSLAPGDHQFRLRHGGRDRNYLLHVPPQGAPGAARPVLLVFHGGGGYAASIQRYSRFDAIADREGFLAVYPSGTGSLRRRLLAWNAGTCCGLAADQQVDDVGFALAVLADLARRTPVDSTRVYATGHSNGAMMAYRLAIATGRVAAVGVVAGGVVTDFTPPRPIPVLHIHSVDDPRALYAGGLGPPFPLTNRRSMHPAIEPMLERWRVLDGCAAEARVTDTLRGPAGSINAGQTATKLVWQPCREGTEVAFWKLTGAGHGWPGTPDERFQEIIGPRTTLIDASEEVWRFVSRFRR